jgi:DNA-binding NtrC family response regulator
MTMPHMSGEEAFHALRHIDPHMKAILTSGYNEQTATNQLTGQGLAGFLQKPFTYEQLLALVQKVLQPV